MMATTIPIACRFVSTDQWLVTHLDNSWTIAQVKQCLLGKFMPQETGSTSRWRRARRDRPLSPITFSAHGHSDDEGNSTNSGKESDVDTLNDVSENFDYLKYKYAPAPRQTGSSGTAQVGRSENANPSGHSTQRTSEPAKYTLLAFSTGQLLEDHFTLKWYALQPNELLELYPRADAVVALPRGVPEAYVRPYFEARVLALRLVNRDLAAEDVVPYEPSKSSKARGKERERRTGSGSGQMNEDIQDFSESKRRDRADKKRRKRMEWRERWVVINQGMFKLCEDRYDPNPMHAAPLSALLSLRRGDEFPLYLPSHPKSAASIPRVSTPSPRSTPLASPTQPQPQLFSHRDSSPFAPPCPATSPTGARQIVCVQFRAGPHPPPHSPTYPHTRSQTYSHSRTKGSLSLVDGRRSSFESGGWWRRSSRDELSATNKSARSACGLDSEDGESVSCSGDRLETGDEREDEDAVWIIMDLLDDTAYHSILRILHRHAPQSCTSSFVAFSSIAASQSIFPEAQQEHPSPSTIIASALSRTPSAVPSLSSLATLIVPTAESKQDAYEARPFHASCDSFPYPEWRLAVVQRARRAGLGVVGRAMELVMFGEEDDGSSEYEENETDFLSNLKLDSDDSESFRASPTTLASAVDNADTTAASPAQDSPAKSIAPILSPMLWRDMLVEDSESDEGSTGDESEREWENWMEDLPRQRQVQARVEERRLRHIEVGARSSMDSNDAIPWAPDWDASWDENGSPRFVRGSGSVEGDASPHSARAQSSSPPRRVLNSYSSADSLIRRTIRGAPLASRARMFRGAGSDLASARTRPRSPLSSQTDAPGSERSGFPGSSMLPQLHQLPLRMPIPKRMRMSVIRTNTASTNEEDAEKKEFPAFRIGSPINGTDEPVLTTLQSPPQQSTQLAASSSARSLLKPARLKLSLASTLNARSGIGLRSPTPPSTPQSLESMTFASPVSESE
ncbi:hypothetical protein WOLCODRAFT_146478 [Wolfiporia cocos MD-104 SS10]|uniref:Uncharacterized protein n=1 Tax=Wolfiporia cocos (strain MD-104) TaxID=742152 RepID=A0A2H3J3X0_WOLCO|nr:hypothetical protein WOLCODRAFT_146478 [Wolfiporia cocos MD-104 SS10]